MQELTNVDLIMSCDLAPSTKLKPGAVMDVLCHILGLERPFDLRAILSGIQKAVFSHEEFISSYESQEENTILDIKELHSYTVLFQKHEKNTMHLTTKEASAYGLVGDFMLCVRDALEKLCPTVEFKLDHQFHVHNAKTYVADSALVSKVVFSIEQIPCFVVEYKPRVAADLSDQEPFHVSGISSSILFTHNAETSCITLFN